MYNYVVVIVEIIITMWSQSHTINAIFTRVWNRYAVVSRRSTRLGMQVLYHGKTGFGTNDWICMQLKEVCYFCHDSRAI